MTRKDIRTAIVGYKILVPQGEESNFVYICNELGIRCQDPKGTRYVIVQANGVVVAEAVSKTVFEAVTNDEIGFEDLYNNVCAVSRAHYKPGEICTADLGDKTLQFQFARVTEDNKFIIGIGMGSDGVITGEPFRYTISKVRRATEEEIETYRNQLDKEGLVVYVDCKAGALRCFRKSHKVGDFYYALTFNCKSNRFVITRIKDSGSLWDDLHWRSGNYYRTHEEAKSALFSMKSVLLSMK